MDLVCQLKQYLQRFYGKFVFIDSQVNIDVVMNLKSKRHSLVPHLNAVVNMMSSQSGHITTCLLEKMISDLQASRS